MLRLFTLLLAAAAVLSGCDKSVPFDSLIPKEELSLAKGFVTKIASRDYLAIESALDPALVTPDLYVRLDEMLKILPTDSTKSVRAVGSNTVTNSKSTSFNFTLEYEYPTAWVLAVVLLERRDGKLVLKGISFVPRSQSLETENQFTLDGKGLLHYVVLALAVVIPLFVLYTLVLCVRTKFAKRKWLWVLFVAVGLIQFHFNWTSGAWEIQPVSFMFLGAGFVKAGPVAPWVFTLAIPMGAILFLFRRQKLQRNAT